MSWTTKNFIYGMGSSLELFPRSDYSKHVPKGSPVDLMHRSFKRVGDSLKVASDKYEATQSEEATTDAKRG